MNKRYFAVMLRRALSLVLALAMTLSLAAPVTVVQAAETDEGAASSASSVVEEPDSADERIVVPEEEVVEPPAEDSSADKGTKPAKADSAPLNRAGESLENMPWDWNVFYLNEDDRHFVSENKDFSVKYQVEFRNSEDLEKNAVKIRIPASLLNYEYDEQGNITNLDTAYCITRDHGAKDICRAEAPTELGIPHADKATQASADMPSFCWKLVEETVGGKKVKYLEITNYRPIPSGSNTSFGVLYKNLPLIDLIDGSTWNLQPTIEVKRIGASTTESKPIEPLKGEIDSAVKLSNVTKLPYQKSGKSYSPGLYTPKQVEAFAGSDWYKAFGSEYSTEEKQKKLLEDYYFVVWRVTADVSATQAYDLFLKDTPTTNVGSEGVKLISVQGSGYSATNTADGAIDNGAYVATKSKEPKKSYAFTVVTAYDKLLLQNNTAWDGKVLNDIYFNAHPYDQPIGHDPDQPLQSAAQWLYSGYNWINHGISDFNKSDDTTHYAWTNAYDLNNTSDSHVDMGSLPFVSSANISSYYNQTHYTQTDSTLPGQSLGDYREGTYYTVELEDSTMWASPNNTFQTDDQKPLSREDYYFNNVSVHRHEKGYDPWEDSADESLLDKNTGVDYTMTIYAKFDKLADKTTRNPSEDWEVVATVPLGDDGEGRYTLTAQQIARQPYAVKAVYNTTNYQSDCVLSVSTCIRGDSPVFFGKNSQPGYATGAAEKQNVYITVRDRSDLRVLDKAGNTLLKDRDSNPLDSLHDYGDSFLYPAIKEAATYKTRRFLESDSGTASAYVRYNLTAYDGYLVASTKDYHTHKVSGIPSPGKESVVFYDLLPYGMELDPASEIIAGRFSTLTLDTATKQENSWVRDNITVKTEVADANYNNTGRKLLKFTLTYSDGDSAKFISGVSDGKERAMWAESWGVSFVGRYSWGDMDLMKSYDNVSAFMSADNSKPIVGTHASESSNGSVYSDNGQDHPTALSDFPFVLGDLDGDGSTDDDIMYAFVEGSDSLTVGTQSGITKRVRADDDEHAPFGVEAVVVPGRDYTYEIKVHADAGELHNIAIFDNLEYSSYMRRSSAGGNESSYYNFEDSFWYGTFKGITTSGLDAVCKGKGDYVLLYHTERAAGKPLDTNHNVMDQGQMVDLLKSMGWKVTTAAQLKNKHEVKALAVVLPSDLTLTPGQSVGFRVHMRAPSQDMSVPDMDASYYSSVGAVEQAGSGGYHLVDDNEYAQVPAEYSYNNAAFYSVSRNTGGQEVGSSVTGNSVRVSESNNATFELVKQFDPEQVRKNQLSDAAYKQKFTFTLETEIDNPLWDPSRADDSDYLISKTNVTPFAAQSYRLYEYQADTWVEIEADKLHATDAAGKLSLKGNQKAVFEVPAKYVYEDNVSKLPEVLHVTERSDALWESSVKFEETGEDQYTYTVTNKNKGVIYAAKELKAAPTSMTEAEKKSIPFTFKLTRRDESGEYTIPVSGVKYYAVSSASANLNGLTPSYTNDKGEFTVHYGEVAAIITDDPIGSDYKLEEVLGEGSDWRPIVGSLEDIITTGTGVTARLSNVYRWKDLFLIKTLTHADGKVDADHPVSFQFKLQTLNAAGELEPVSGVSWAVVDSRNQIITHSVPNENYQEPTPEEIAADEAWHAVHNEEGHECDEDCPEDPCGSREQPFIQVPFSSGTTGEDGILAPTLTSTTSRIKLFALEEGVKYTVTEMTSNGMAVNAAGNETVYRPSSDTASVTMPVYAVSSNVKFTNDRTLRPISVKKTVASSSNADKNLFFKMNIKTAPNSALFPLSDYAGRAYTVTDDRGRAVTPTAAGTLVTEAGAPVFKTDENGNFLIKDGWTVTFPDVGAEGQVKYAISECKNGDYAADRDGNATTLTQIVPVDNDDVTGTMGAEGSSASFVNGSAGSLLIGKEFSPTTEGAQQLLDFLADPTMVAQMTPAEKERLKVTVTFTQNGAPVELSATKLDTIGYNTDTPTAVTQSQWTIYPWERLLISTNNIPSGVTYTVSESDEDRVWKEFFEFDNDNGGPMDGLLLEAKAKTPSLDIVKGDSGVKLLVNELTVNRRGSVIRKLMDVKHSDNTTHPVTPGARLTFRVERYDGTAWLPAEGVIYCVRDEARVLGLPDSPESVLLTGSMTTGPDGLIEVYKSSNPDLWPTLYFDEVVRLDTMDIPSVAYPQKGNLCIVEVPEQSDSSWGRLSEWEIVDENHSYRGVSVDKFLNSNIYHEFALSKALEGTEDPTQKFTFLLEQVRRHNGSIAPDPEDETRIDPNFDPVESNPAGNIAYDIYDKKGDHVGEGVTTAKGEIFLHAGQTAKLQLPESTIWTVRELQDTPYQLRDIDNMTHTWRIGDTAQVVVHIEGTEKDAQPTALVATWRTIQGKTDESNKAWFNQTYGYAPGDLLDFNSDIELKLLYDDGTEEPLHSVKNTEGLTSSIDAITENDKWVCSVGDNTGSTVITKKLSFTYTCPDGSTLTSGELDVKLLPRGTALPGTLSVPMCYVNNAIAAAEAYLGHTVEANDLGYTEKDNHLAEFNCGEKHDLLRVYPRVFKESDGYHYLAFDTNNGTTLILPAIKDENAAALIPETVNIQYGGNYPRSTALGVYSFSGDAVKVTAEEGAVVYTNEQKLNFFNPRSNGEKEKVFDEAVTDVWLPDWNVDANFKMAPATDQNFLGGCTSNILIVHCNQATMNYLVDKGFKGSLAAMNIFDAASSSDTKRAFKIKVKKTIAGYTTSATKNLYFVVYDKDPRTHSGVELVTPKKADGTPDVLKTYPELNY